MSNFYDDMVMRGRVPVMRTYPGRCDPPTGFKDFYDPATIHPENEGLHYELKEHLLDQIRRERREVEVRVQMDFPEVYSEIDRLREEARLRVSIYWPVLALSTVLFVHGIWLAVAGLPLAGLLLMHGKRSARESIEKTWAPLIAGKVTSPTLDVMEERWTPKIRPRDFGGDFGSDLAAGVNYRAVEETHAESDRTRVWS